MSFRMRDSRASRAVLGEHPTSSNGWPNVHGINKEQYQSHRVSSSESAGARRENLRSSSNYRNDKNGNRKNNHDSNSDRIDYTHERHAALNNVFNPSYAETMESGVPPSMSSRSRDPPGSAPSSANPARDKKWDMKISVTMLMLVTAFVSTAVIVFVIANIGLFAFADITTAIANGAEEQSVVNSVEYRRQLILRTKRSILDSINRMPLCALQLARSIKSRQVDLEDHEAVERLLLSLSVYWNVAYAWYGTREADTVEVLRENGASPADRPTFSLISSMHNTPRFEAGGRKNKSLLIWELDEFGLHDDSQTWNVKTYSPRERPWFNATRHAREPIWTQPYMWLPSLVLGIDACVPVYDDSALPRLNPALDADPHLSPPQESLMAVACCDQEMVQMSEILIAAAQGARDIVFVVEYEGPGVGLLIGAARGGRVIPVSRVSGYTPDGKPLNVRADPALSEDVVLSLFTNYTLETFGSWENFPANLTITGDQLGRNALEDGNISDMYAWQVLSSRLTGEIDGLQLDMDFKRAEKPFKVQNMNWLLIVAVEDNSNVYVEGIRSDYRERRERNTVYQLLVLMTIILLMFLHIPTVLYPLTKPFAMLRQSMKQVQRGDKRSIDDVDLSQVDSLFGFRCRDIRDLFYSWLIIRDCVDGFNKFLPGWVVKAFGRVRMSADIHSSRAGTLWTEQVYHRMPLEECLKLSIRFMTCFLETVEAFGGTVADFHYDGIVAFWTDSYPNHAQLACNAAVNLQASMFSLVQSIEKEFMERVSKNEAGDAPHGTADNDKANAAGYNLYPVFGVHSGLCNVGNYGSARRLKYGITGDTFDTAKRLLAMCKKGQVQLLVSGATEEMVHAQFLRKYVATVQVAGSKSDQAFHILGRAKTARSVGVVREVRDSADYVGEMLQEEAQDPGWLCCAFDQSSLCGYIKFSLLQNVLILLALGLVGAAVYTVLELKPTTLGTVLIVVTMVTAVTLLVTTPASMLFDALRQGMSGGKKDGVIPAARMQSSVGFSDDSHAKPPENDTNAFSFSIMALVIGFVLVLVVTALVVQIIFQTLVVQMSLESGLVLNDSTVLFTKRVTGELHTRAYQIVTEWINSAVSCAEFTADALRDRRLNVSDTEMIATYLHRSHSVFNIEALSVATALGEVFAVEYPHIHTSVIDVDPYSLGDQIDYFVTNRELNPSAEFTGVNKPLVRYTLNDTSRFDVGSAAVQGFRYDLCNQGWYMTAREESAPRILGPRINYRTERDNGGEALHVTVAFNACVPVLQPAGTPSAPTWSRVRDMCGDGAAEYVSCCGNDFSDLTKELAVFTRGWSAAAFVVEARDGRLIAAAAKGQGLEVVRITPGEVTGFDRLLATDPDAYPMIRQVGRWVQRTPGAAWNATGGAQQIEPGSANETGLIFVASAMLLGPEGWRLDPVDGRWAPGRYNISTTSAWALVVAVEETHFQRFTSAASLNAQARYEIFLMHVVAAAVVLLVLFTLVAFMVARLISIPVNDLRARMEIVQSDEFVRKITKGPEDSHISEIRIIQQLLNVTVDRLILFDKYVPVTVRQQLTSQRQNDRKIAGNLWMELRQITIIHTCLDGFAQLRELTSMDAILHLNKEYASQAMEIIEELGGTIEDVSGDKIVSFWMDEASEYPNHAELACQAVLRMQDAANDCIRRWRANGAPHASKARQIKLQFSAGILTTDTFVGNFGTPTRLRYGVSGDGISQSLRLLNLTRIYNAPIIATPATLDGAAYLTIAAPQRPERVIVTASATQVDRGGVMTEGRGGGMRLRPSGRAGDGRRGSGHIDEDSVASFSHGSGGQDGSWSFRAKRPGRTAGASPESTGGVCAALRCSVLGCLGPRARTGGEEEAVPPRQEEAPANPGYLQMVKGVKAAFHWSFVAKVPAMESSMRFNSVAENESDEEAKAFVDIYQLKGRKEADDLNDLRRDLRSPPTRSHIGTEDWSTLPDSDDLHHLNPSDVGARAWRNTRGSWRGAGGLRKAPTVSSDPDSPAAHARGAALSAHGAGAGAGDAQQATQPPQQVCDLRDLRSISRTQVAQVAQISGDLGFVRPLDLASDADGGQVTLDSKIKMWHASIEPRAADGSEEDEGDKDKSERARPQRWGWSSFKL